MRDTLAVIFDFDDTLTHDSFTVLLRKYKVSLDDFWKRRNKLVVEQGWDPTLAYIHLFLRLVGKNRPLGALRNADLKSFGATLQPYPGVATLFRDLRKIVEPYEVDVQFYIVSGGFQDVVDGFRFRSEFKGAWGCTLTPATSAGAIRFIKRAITFTEKTKYLFQINKGLKAEETEVNPYLVNRDVPEIDRPVPFKNMFYIGDGLTDIPCFSLVQNKGGRPFGVFDPKSKGSARVAWLGLVAPRRVVSLNAPRYSESSTLGALLRTAIQTRCAEIKLERESIWGGRRR